MRFVPPLAVLSAGLALYISRGVLDQIMTAAGVMRVALLPPWQALVGFVALAALGLLLLNRGTARRNTATVRPPLGPLVLPAFGLLVLLLPYLPVLADGFPALQILAGPWRGVIWLVIVMQLVWVLWQARLLRAEWLHKWTLRRSAAAIGLLAMIVSGAAAGRLTGTSLYPAGDEPHYLIIAQSLWRDGDLKIENNHARRDYAEYFGIDLDPHYLTRGVDGEIYSIHPVGMPVLIAPVYAAGGYRAVVLFFVLMTAIAAALMWHAVARAINATGAATFAWAAVVTTTPFLYNSFAIYPEIPAALAAVIALTVTFGDAGLVSPKPARFFARRLIVGMACATLPWLSTKYAPMSAMLVGVALARIVWPAVAGPPSPISSLRSAVSGPESPLARVWVRGRNLLHALRTRSIFGTPGTAGTISEVRYAGAVLIPYGASLVAWFSFFYAVWGTPKPQAPYGAMLQMDPRNLIFGAPGLFFDQEYGLLPYAPVYILALTGLWGMWRSGGDSRRRAIEIALVFLALVATVGAYRIWWGGSASPGRPLASGLLLLMWPIATAFCAAPAGSARRASHHLLLWISIGITIIALVAQQGFLIANRRDGTSSLLEYLSPQWPAWTLAPSFIYHEAWHALMYAGVWLSLAALAALILARVRTALPGAASLAAISTCFLAIALAALVVPLIPVAPPWPGIDGRWRPRLSLLDDFDTVARPIGIEYSPMRVVPAEVIPTRVVLGVEPGSRVDPQPIRVLHNGRFSLPAGHYRIEVEWSGARMGETIGLQIGRAGDAWRTWDVDPRPGERWTMEFVVPVDASFIGLRGSAELEQVIRRIAIAPLAVLNVAQRPKVPTMIGASQYGDVAVFYYDDNASAEPTGFWVLGKAQRTRVSFHRARTDVPLVLQVHSGLIANRLHLSMSGWTHTMDLEPELPARVEIPAGDRSLVTLELKAEDAFVPMQVNPSSPDARALGIWVEVVNQ